MFSSDALRDIIRISLEPLGWWSREAEELLLMTAAHESRLGKYNKQINGPALGLYQIEPATLDDNYVSYLNYRRHLLRQVSEIAGVPSWASLPDLQYNPIYGTIHARLKYLRSPGKLPSDHWAMAEYAKEYYNSPLGAATPGDYYNAYHSLVLS